MTPKTSGNNITEGDRIHNYFISPKLAENRTFISFKAVPFPLDAFLLKAVSLN